MQPDRMHQAVSLDGTSIMGGVHGQGPPLVLVPGGPADGETGWFALLPSLSKHFTCYTINTRGRGPSGDHPDHSRERIVEDIVAFVESIGDSVLLFGHSAGGAHVLEAVANTTAVRALAVYEPTLAELAEPGLRARFEDAFVRVRRAVVNGRPAVGAQLFLEELALANDEELAALAAAGAAQEMAPLVPLVLDEAAQSGPPQLSDLSLLDDITVPVLLLHGDRTNAFYKQVARHVADRLAHCRLRVLPGLGHLGPEIAPEPVTNELLWLAEAAVTTGEQHTIVGAADARTDPGPNGHGRRVGRPSDVSVIGTGAMGSALAEALAAAGAEVSVWNRTNEKAEALAGSSIHPTGSVAEALTSSPLTIVSVADHKLGCDLVQEAGVELDGAVVASTSFANPDQARTYAATVSALGGCYLDLAIAAYPSEVRSGAGFFIVSGDPAAYEAHRERFESIGQVNYIDDAPAAACIGEMAVLLAYLPMAVGLLQGRRICDHHGFATEWFERLVLELYPHHIRALLEGASESTHASASDVEASVDTWAAAAAEYADYLRELSLDAGMYDALHQLFTATSEAGHGGADWTRVAEHVATR